MKLFGKIFFQIGSKKNRFLIGDTRKNNIARSNLFSFFLKLNHWSASNVSSDTGKGVSWERNRPTFSKIFNTMFLKGREKVICE